MTAITANGITIEVERHGDEAGAPLLLIRGLGSQIIHWPAALIDGFVDAGFHVIAFDNRDSGLSQSFENGPSYGVADMAADAVGVLDALGIGRAHALGISMGGMILQEALCTRPDRLLSATIVMSSSRAAGLPERSAEMQRLLLADPGDPETDLEGVVEHILRCDRAWGNPGFPFDEDERRDLIRRAIQRRYCPDGVLRQARAVLESPARPERLAGTTTPTLVIHGDSDALVSIEHGRDIAARIPGARLVEVAGMGHDLDGGVSEIVVREVVDHVRASAGPSF